MSNDKTEFSSLTFFPLCRTATPYPGTTSLDYTHQDRQQLFVGLTTTKYSDEITIFELHRTFLGLSGSTFKSTSRTAADSTQHILQFYYFPWFLDAQLWVHRKWIWIERTCTLRVTKLTPLLIVRFRVCLGINNMFFKYFLLRQKFQITLHFCKLK